jgi:hypothetical protein
MSINLEEKINILYDFLKSSKTCYINKIKINEIELDDIKISKGDIANKILSQILEGKLQYLFDIDNNLYFNRYSNLSYSLIRIGIDNKKNNNNDSLISYILSELVLEGLTKHILMPILNIDVKLSDLSILKNMELNSKFKKYLDSNTDAICSVKLREKINNLTNLKEYVKSKKIVNYKVLLFQIIHTLAVIKNIYTYFKHNNLNLENIFILINDNYDDSIINKYNINNKVYNIPNQEFEIKLTNFDESIIFNKNILDINYTKLTDGNDLDVLVNELLKLNIDTETKNFLKFIQKNDPSYTELLDNEYFQQIENPVQNDVSANVVAVKMHKRLIKINVFNSKLKENIKSNVMGKQKNLFRIIKQHGGLDNKTVNIPYTKEINNPFDEKPKPPPYDPTKPKPPYDPTKPKPPYDPSKPKYDPSAPKPPYDPTKPKYDPSAPKPPYDPPAPKPTQTTTPVSTLDKVKDTIAQGEMPPALIPIYDEMGSLYYPSILQPKNEPIQKVYNISLANPIGDYTTLKRVFEDILPGDPRTLSYNTTFERENLINFIRTSILNYHDGEDMNITGGNNSLLSFIKTLDLNPYALNENPYKDLADDFLIFRSAYPIRYEKSSLQIANPSLGLNVRLYKMTEGESRCHEINNKINQENFNLWREIIFYKYVRDNIINKKISPHFIASILHKIDKKSNIDWYKLQTIKKGLKAQDKSINVNDLHNLNDFKKLTRIIQKNRIIKVHCYTDLSHSFLVIWNSLISTLVNPNLEYTLFNVKDPDTHQNLVKYKNKPIILIKHDDITLKYRNKLCLEELIIYINTLIHTEKLDLNKASGNTLVLLTEAPNNNIIRWSTPIYESYGTVRKMISSGYHDKNIWKVILFQVIYTLSILQEHQIYFDELSLENNFHIKNLNVEQTNLSYWIYVIDNFNYYVPNYGFMVVFDTKYSDISNDTQKYKICSPKLYKKEPGYVGSTSYEDLIYSQFREIINPINFSSKLKSLGGLMPDPDIINFISSIYNDNSKTKSIKYYINKYFGELLHNKIGTPLNRSERDNINILNRPKFQNAIGRLLIYQTRYDEYEWVIYKGEDPSKTTPTKHLILTKENNKIIDKAVFAYNLLNYIEYEKVLPISTELVNFDEKHCLEIYTFD